MGHGPGSLAPEARMGNDIARQFAHLPEQEAATAIATHLEKFWEPRMRDRLRALVEAGDTGVDPLVGAAVAGLPETAGADRVDRREKAKPTGG